MYLSKTRVRNFRNLVDVTMDLSPGLNVIVGENNCGKTNFLDAIRAALGHSAATGEPIRLTKDDRHQDANGNVCAEPIRVDLYFEGMTELEQAQFLEILNFNERAPSQSVASIHFEWSWDEKAKRWHVRRWGGERSSGDVGVPDEVLQSVPVTLLGALRDALVALSPGRGSRLGQLLRSVASDEDRKNIELIFDVANKDLQKEPLIKKSRRKDHRRVTAGIWA